MTKPKEVTIYDLVRKLNSSIATDSSALKEAHRCEQKNRKKMYDLAEEMGYRHNHFARNLREQRQLADEIKTNNFSTDIGCLTAH